MKRKILLFALLGMALCSACGKKDVKKDDPVTKADSAGLETCISDFESEFKASNGKVKASNLDQYLDKLQIKVMSDYDFGIESIDRVGNTLVFSFEDDSKPYEYDKFADLEIVSENGLDALSDVPNVGGTVSYADE